MPMPHEHPAVVIELGVNGLGTIRGLHWAGVPVVGVYTTRGPGCYSRHCSAVRFPPIAAEGNRFTEKLIDLCRRLRRPPVLFPTGDESLAYLSRHREELSADALFTLPEPALLEKALTKEGNRELALAAGVPTPETCAPRNGAELARAARAIHYPTLFKPSDTLLLKLPGDVKNILFRDEQALLHFFAKHEEFVGQGVLQRVIPSGDGHLYQCAGFFDENSDPLALCTFRKVRQLPPDYGVTSYGESVYVPEIVELTTSFMKKIGLTGLVAAEFARDRESGKFYFLEINARTSLPHALFLSSGVNLPYTSYLYSTGRRDQISSPAVRQKEKIFWVHFLGDAASFWRRRRKSGFPTGEWLRSLLRVRSFAVFAPGDPGPFLYSLGRLARVIARKLFGGRLRRLPVSTPAAKRKSRAA